MVYIPFARLTKAAQHRTWLTKHVTFKYAKKSPVRLTVRNCIAFNTYHYLSG